jgi:hypothetical protein
MMGQGSPFRQKLKGNIDDLYLDCNGAMLWIKESDSGKPTGWKCLGHVVPADPRGRRCCQSSQGSAGGRVSALGSRFRESRAIML